jgi:hypothetical protein
MHDESAPNRRSLLQFLLLATAALGCFTGACGGSPSAKNPYGYVSSGYDQNAGGGYYESSAGGYYQAAGGYDQTGGGYVETSTGSYDTGSTGGYVQTSTGGYDTGSTGGYVQTSTGGYDTGSTGGYVQTSTGGYVQTSTSGGFTVTSTTSDGDEGPAELPFGYRNVRMGASCSECDQSAVLAAGLVCAVAASGTCGDSAGLCFRGPLDGSGWCTHGCRSDGECQPGWSCVDAGVGTAICRQ